MGVLAVEVVLAVVPATVLVHEGALVRVIEVQVRRSPEVLLAMSVVALRPFVLLVDKRTKTCFVRIYHELLNVHIFFVFV